MKSINLFLVIVILNFINNAQAITELAHLDHNWYPSEITLLKNNISELTIAAAKKYYANLNANAIKAIIVPHAGYNYSGTVATSVYRLCNPKIKKIIILAPSHHSKFTGVALPAFDEYKTPLGSVKVHTADINKLIGHSLFNINKTIYQEEHALEIELPLIQTFFNKDLTIVPLIIGSINCQQAASIAKQIKPLIDLQTLCVVSTDFTHYGKQFNFEPFTDHLELNIKNLDSQLIELIEAGKCTPFTEFVNKTGATICGLHPLKILLNLLEINSFGAVEPRLIAYDTSSLNSKQARQQSVSYVGMLFTNEKLATTPFANRLTGQEQQALLKEAYDILSNLFAPKKVDHELLFPIKSFGVKQTYGAFTTIEKNIGTKSELRGCIGHIHTKQPLYETIATVTQSAALSDQRFKPLQKKELSYINLKLAILSPNQTITNYREITLGQHGVILESHGRSALFLPEVATKFNWNIPQMLAQLSQKAGLPSDSWQDPHAKFKVFTTISIG